MTDKQVAQLLEQGRHLQRAGHLQQAERCCQLVLGQRPKHPEALNLLGMVAIDAQNFDAGIDLLRKAVRLQPKNAAFRNNLGHAFILNGEAEKALYHLERALALGPRMLDVLVNTARANQMLGRADEACKLCRKAIAIDPGHVPAWRGLADALFDLGRHAEAVGHLRRTLKDHPGNLDVLQTLAREHRFSAGDEEVEQVEALLREKSRPATSRSLIHWSAGKMYADLGRYDDAFANFQLSHAASGKTFNIDDYRRFVDKSIELFTPAFFKCRGNLGNPSVRPLFIVGMPRSGTTLTEQILASHPAVAAGGELPDLERSVRLLTGRTEYHGGAFFQRAREAGNGAINTEAARYLDVLKRVSPTAGRVTDKMPHNFKFLGLIALLFPNARVVHCRRNAMDTCVSCFTLRFNDDHAFNRDLTALGLYYREYVRLMDHWASVLPVPIVQFRLEDLIAAQEPETARLLDGVGLSWDDACLDFHKTEGSVQTPSRQQVRQPLYNSGIGRWRRYERHLGPLREALGDLADA